MIFIVAAAFVFLSVSAHAATTESLDALIHAQMSGGAQDTAASAESAAPAAGSSSNEAMRAIEEQQARASREAAEESARSGERQPAATAPAPAAAEQPAAPAPAPAATVPPAVPVPAAAEQPAEPVPAPAAAEQPAEPAPVPAAPAPQPADVSAMPKIYDISLALISDQNKQGETRARSEEFYAAGRRDKAASVIGRALAEEHDFSLHYLGSFCLKTLPAAGGTEAQAEFLTGFMRGYSKCGVLMFTTDAVKSFTAYPPSRSPVWKTVPAGASAASSDERIYKGSGVVFIPFAYGTKFMVDIVAKPGADVKMWKMLPGSVVVRNWQGGVWEKEVTVIGVIK